jgi:aldehyde:ferredoxin oxidoreductase
MERKGPEYETIIGFGPNIGVTDLPWIAMVSELCDRYGMDTISLSNTIGLVLFLNEQGILPNDVRGDLRLEWGNPQSVERLVHLTARREGIGRFLAEGAASLAERLGATELAVQVNGLEVPYHDPRGFSGMAVVYLTSPRGACQNQGDYYLVDTGQSMEQIGVEFYDRQDGAEKSASIAKNQDWRILGNSLVLCLLANIEPDDLVRLIAAATGFDFDLDELLLIGERSWNLKRLVNHKLGLKRLPDSLPAPLQVPLKDGASSGYVPPVEDMLQAYFEARDWDPLTTRPSSACLRKLNLKFASEET